MAGKKKKRMTNYTGFVAFAFICLSWFCSLSRICRNVISDIQSQVAEGNLNIPLYTWMLYAIDFLFVLIGKEPFPASVCARSCVLMIGL